ncbi:S8 family peptidase [Ideonella paludis]|uniref:S8 family serine peptidase n=1 Tax=Ideonella paludis TaxID=1233411 RepID=A0ABS5DV85_9BURK|nr:S8 family peptidase [Ideonella paludis]MBQ0935066.1 S8 family serine peptidase [Ideonella paludis]
MNRTFSRLTMLAATMAACTFSSLASASPQLVDASLANPAHRYKPSELIVQFKPGMRLESVQQSLRGLGLSSIKTLRSIARGGKAELHLVKLPAHFSVPEAIQWLRAHDAIDFAEPNWIVTTQAAPADPYYTNGSLWGYYGDTSPTQQNQYGSQAGEAFNAGKKCKAGVVVGIIDEGVMNTHPDTKAGIWKNPGEIPNNGIDDDGNGYIDDVTGWDFLHDDKTTFDGTTDDHGTHVSGTIGARTNSQGIVGICPTVKMISAKFLEGSGSTADAILSVDYITDLKIRHDLNLVATNNSWGGGGFSQALKDAIDRAGAADILFVAAAGNSGLNSDVTPNYPSGYTSANIISVASITNTGARSSFSNYGLTTVDIAAPGSSIWSTVPTSTGAGYANYSGTSMATPHVTGAVAYYASRHPGSTAAQIKAAILAAAVPTASMTGKCVTGGRLDVSGF